MVASRNSGRIRPTHYGVSMPEKSAGEHGCLNGDEEAVCLRFWVDFCQFPDQLKVGMADNVRDGLVPLNGLRHLPTEDTTRWHIWAGMPTSVRRVYRPVVKVWNPRFRERAATLRHQMRMLMADTSRLRVPVGLDNGA